MEWITQNWFLLLLLMVFAGAYLYRSAARAGHDEHEEHKGNPDAEGRDHREGHGCC